MKIKQIEKNAMLAIQNLRISYHKRGHPFMINSKFLPTNQCYFEYPDGSVALVSLSRKDNDFKIEIEYSTDEAIAIKKKHNLI